MKIGYDISIVGTCGATDKREFEVQDSALM